VRRTKSLESEASLLVSLRWSLSWIGFVFQMWNIPGGHARITPVLYTWDIRSKKRVNDWLLGPFDIEVFLSMFRLSNQTSLWLAMLVD
jgi:hypothetical protein